MGSRPPQLLAVTPGDPEGIGPEIVWKTLQALPANLRGIRLLCVGAREPFDRLGALVEEISWDQLASRSVAARLAKENARVLLLKAPSKAARGVHLPGFQSGWSIERATRLVQEGSASALVTGPISKERLQKGGFPFPGHTELLAELCGVRDVTMMLANSFLRVTLVTTHLALKNVPTALRKQEIVRCISHTVTHLHKWWKVPRPRVAIAALNPHAGEAGIFGNEETRVIEPAIQAARRKFGDTATLSGPHPADTLFAKNALSPPRQRYDAVVCMYHDQALIPVKLLDFPRTVNVTLGLPIVRTSVDHGVGFDIAGKGLADPSSFQAALDLAIKISRNRRQGSPR